MCTIKTFAECEIIKANINLVLDPIEKNLQTFERGTLGLIPDDVLKSKEYIKANSNFWENFKKLQEINKYIMKHHKKEARESQLKKRFKK